MTHFYWFGLVEKEGRLLKILKHFEAMQPFVIYGILVVFISCVYDQIAFFLYRKDQTYHIIVHDTFPY